MDNHRSQLIINLGHIAQRSIGYSRDFLLSFPAIYIHPDLNLQNLEGRIEVSRTSEGLLTRNEFQASVDSTCGRCLEEFNQALKTEFAELFTFSSHADADTDLIYPEDGQIDFGPIIREYLLLELPINPLCQEGCKGLCPICGENLNTHTCDHEPDNIDPRLAKLKALLDED
jgi:uncharacterized protein